MRPIQTTLYSFAIPFVALPVMAFSLAEIPAFIKGTEFRALIAEVLIQIATGVVDAGIIALFDSTYGLL